MSKSVEFRHISRRFALNGKDSAVGPDRFSLLIPRRELQVWLGPSGSGKSTAARVLSGFEQPESGELYLGDDLLLPSLKPEVRSRELGIYHVFQSAGLYPNMTVLRNLTAGSGVRVQDVRNEIHSLFTDLFPTLSCQSDVDAFLKKRSHQLSGGERQRIGICKALLRRPTIAIFDEPLSNVDAPLRTRIRRLIRRWQRDNAVTCIWITHDQAEAIAVADSIAVVKDGRVLQCDSVENLVRSPNHLEVAQFLSSGFGSPLNVIPLGSQVFSHWFGSAQSSNGKPIASIGFRAADVYCFGKQTGAGQLKGVVQESELTPNGQLISVELKESEVAISILLNNGSRVNLGDLVYIRPPNNHKLLWFSSEGQVIKND